MIVTYLCYLFIYYWFFVIPFSPIMLGTLHLSERCEYVPVLRHLLTAVMLALVLLYFIVIPWLAHVAALAKAYDNESFSGAIAVAVLQLRLRLSFLPIIGGIFAPRQTHEPEDKGTRLPGGDGN